MRTLELTLPPRKHGIQKTDRPENASTHGLFCPVESEEKEPDLFGDDFILLADETRAWILQTQDISYLEAYRNETLVHLAKDELVIRRSLNDCERRLKTALFFRASRSCIVNLSHVRRSRFLEDERLMFLLKDGKEVVFSRRQGVLFRKAYGL